MSCRQLSGFGSPWSALDQRGAAARLWVAVACCALLGCQSSDETKDAAPDAPTGPRLDTVSPLTGPPRGGIPLILRGQNLAPGAEVRVAGAIAANATSFTSGELRITLPAGPGAIGPVPIEIRNPDGPYTVRPDLFVYGSILEKTLSGAPLSIVSADFDGDGRPDLATLGRWDDSVTVLFNTGAGRFDRLLQLPLGGQLTVQANLAAVDLDSDGKSDIVVSERALTFRNLGGGSFAPPTPLLSTAAPDNVTVGDYNGDGRPDLALLSWGSPTGWLLLNQGALRFSPPSTLALGAKANSVTAAAGDFDGDGKDDLAVAVEEGVVVATSVSATPGVGKLLALPGHPVSVSTGDLNGDGLRDLVVTTNFTKDVQVLVGDGAAGFSGVASLPVGDNPSQVTIGDLNGDGIAELIVANRWSSSLSVLSGKGGGSFSPGASLPVGSQPISTIMADLDGDGRPDLASVNSVGSSVSLVLSGDYGGIGPTLSYPVGGAPSAIFVQDLDEDGSDDVVVRSSAGTVNILFSDKMGWFNRIEFPGAAADSAIVGVGDLDGDGRADLISRSADMMQVSPNKGGGRFGRWVGTPVSGSLFGFATADFNRDGHLDMVALPYDQAKYEPLLLLGTGMATFSPPVRVVTTFPSGALAVADFNGDGLTDLAVAYVSNVGVGILLGTGLGGFGPSRETDHGGYEPTSITAADINGDRRMDLAVTLEFFLGSKGPGLLSVLLGKGDGTFAAPALYTTGVDPSAAAVGDLNGDGIPDLVVANRLGGSVTLFLGKGGGALERANSDGVQVNGNPTEVKLLDINADGKLDLILTSQITDNLSILLNRL